GSRPSRPDAYIGWTWKKSGLQRIRFTDSAEYQNRDPFSSDGRPHLESHRNTVQKSDTSRTIFCVRYGASGKDRLSANRPGRDMFAVSSVAEFRHLQGLSRPRRFLYGS